LGSGTLPWKRTIESGVNVSGGTDYGGGDSSFMPYVLNMAFKQHMSEPDGGYSMHPAEMLHLGTLSGARALDLEDRIGTLEAGKEADFVVIDPALWPSLGRTMANLVHRDDPATDRDSRLFTLLMQANPVNLSKTYVRGQELDRGE
jgi:guanine deaminase